MKLSTNIKPISFLNTHGSGILRTLVTGTNT